ncbi:zinc-binding dehydrogenase [Streptomyces sp. 8N616]|uniref:zinc-binding dehydrogenase n=1 Tax=Streptomyces sp. 8N616 TaxID=3457414 RepID=UPI003FD452B5
MARRIGAVPLATTRTGAKKRELLDLGAAHVIVSEGEDVAREARRLTGGRGAEVIFDAIGGPGFRPLGEALAGRVDEVARSDVQFPGASASARMFAMILWWSSRWCIWTCSSTTGRWPHRGRRMAVWPP